MGKFAILTSSDQGAAGTRGDLGGDKIVKALIDAGFDLINRSLVPDDQNLIEEILRSWADSGQVDLICTTGGTGLAPRDVTPDATANVIDIEVPGMAEAIRAQTFHITPFSMVSRAMVGIRGRSLIINLPGSPEGAIDCLKVVLPVLPHALQVISGRPDVHERG